MKMICKFLIVILFFSIATVYADTIRDPGLEAAIKRKLYNSNPSWPIPVEDLEELTELSARAKGIVDLTGLEYCTNLEELNLEENKITDLSPLSQLVNLKMLYLNDNQITDISPLVLNSGLSKVDLTGNPLSRDSIKVYIPELKLSRVNVVR